MFKCFSCFINWVTGKQKYGNIPEEVESIKENCKDTYLGSRLEDLISCVRFIT